MILHNDTLNSDEARQLLAGLYQLLPLAEAVDAQRGHTVGQELPLAPVESPLQTDKGCGNDIARTLAHLALRLRRETAGH